MTQDSVAKPDFRRKDRDLLDTLIVFSEATDSTC